VPLTLEEKKKEEEERKKETTGQKYNGHRAAIIKCSH